VLKRTVVPAPCPNTINNGPNSNHERPPPSAANHKPSCSAPPGSRLYGPSAGGGGLRMRTTNTTPNLTPAWGEPPLDDPPLLGTEWRSRKPRLFGGGAVGGRRRPSTRPTNTLLLSAPAVAVPGPTYPLAWRPGARTRGGRTRFPSHSTNQVRQNRQAFSWGQQAMSKNEWSLRHPPSQAADGLPRTKIGGNGLGAIVSVRERWSCVWGSPTTRQPARRFLPTGQVNRQR